MAARGGIGLSIATVDGRGQERGGERAEAPPFDHGLVAADVVRGGRRRPVQGRFHGQYVVENGRLHVKLEGIDAGAPGEPGPSLWVPGEGITRPDPLVLRSEIWELPAGTERDFVLRSVTLTFSDQMRECGAAVELGRQWPGAVELVFTMEVPLERAVDVMAALLPLRQRLGPRPSPRRAPRDIIAGRTLTEQGRAGAAYQLSHLPAWVESRHFWSEFAWSAARGRLLHTVQFSLPERHQRAVGQRFRLAPDYRREKDRGEKERDPGAADR